MEIASAVLLSVMKPNCVSNTLFILFTIYLVNQNGQNVSFIGKLTDLVINILNNAFKIDKTI